MDARYWSPRLKTGTDRKGNHFFPVQALFCPGPLQTWPVPAVRSSTLERRPSNHSPRRGASAKHIWKPQSLLVKFTKCWTGAGKQEEEWAAIPKSPTSPFLAFGRRSHKKNCTVNHTCMNGSFRLGLPEHLCYRRKSCNTVNEKELLALLFPTKLHKNEQNIK